MLFHFFQNRRWLIVIGLMYYPIGLFANTDEREDMEEIVVWGTRDALHGSGDYPSHRLSSGDLVSINSTTTEDLVSYEPGLIIRKRFIGDANGTIGIRGANMFQTTRSMVFADGVPLHYFLQTSWNGSPRWSLVSSDEIAEIDISYGPFSAEYSGNAMGGVINIETAIPSERKFHAEVSSFHQHFDSLGYDEGHQGYKGFLSFGDKFGDFSLYTSVNRLINEGHPQTFYFSEDKDIPEGIVATQVTGGTFDENEYGKAVLYYGNAGSTSVQADQFKIKLGYESGEWLTIVNLAYEDRSSDDTSVQNYLVDETGNSVWNGWVEQDGTSIEIESEDFLYGLTERRSMLVGGRTRGPIAENWLLELSASHFEILSDKTYETNVNPNDPGFIPGFNVSRQYGDTGWSTVDLKLAMLELFGISRLDLSAGFHHDRYKLAIENSSGGKSQTNALFLQSKYQITNLLRLSLGGRYEKWQSDDGFYVNRGTTQHHQNRSEHHFSPKFSLNFEPRDWSFTYAVARAYRFPIVEELFQNERTARSRSVANVSLRPEQGLHHNFEIGHAIGNGSFSLSLFRETIENVIFSQTGVVGGTTLRTFLPVDRVVTNGAELTIQQTNLFNSGIDLRFNLSYLDAEISRNSANPALEANDFPRMPGLRANMLLTWHANDQLDIGGGIRYASDSFGDLDNRDRTDNVFGAHDEFLFANVRGTYQFSKNLGASLGIDNLTDQVAYVHHPWPGRTLFLELTLDY